MFRLLNTKLFPIGLGFFFLGTAHAGLKDVNGQWTGKFESIWGSPGYYKTAIHSVTRIALHANGNHFYIFDQDNQWLPPDDLTTEYEIRNGNELYSTGSGKLRARASDEADGSLKIAFIGADFDDCKVPQELTVQVDGNLRWEELVRCSNRPNYKDDVTGILQPLVQPVR